MVCRGLGREEEEGHPRRTRDLEGQLLPQMARAQVSPPHFQGPRGPAAILLCASGEAVRLVHGMEPTGAC